MREATGLAPASATSTLVSRGVAVVHPGVQYAPRVVEQIERCGMLSEFWSGIAFSDRGIQGKLIKWIAASKIGRLLAARIVRGVPRSRIRLIAGLELRAWRELRRGMPFQEVMHDRNRDFQLRIPERVFRENQVIVGFDTSSWILGERVRRHPNARLVLDQSIAHPRSKAAVYCEVQRTFSAWSEDLERRNAVVLAAEDQEHELAEVIVAASTFTKRSLVENGVPSGKVRLNPYGVDSEQFSPRGPRTKRPLRFVFVGLVGARKGIPLLLDVWKEVALQNAELWLVGHLPERFSSLVSGVPGVYIKGKVSHALLPDILKQCDVFVFPSYFEGFGLVLLEAMACGLPIIGTDATAAPDILHNRGGGFSIPSSDGRALAESLRHFAANPGAVDTMGAEARAIAESYTWNAFGDRWAAILQDVADSMTDRSVAPR